MIESSLRLQRLMKQPLRWLVLRETFFYTKQNVSHRTFNSGSFVEKSMKRCWKTKIYILLVSTSFFQRSCWSVMAILMWKFLPCLSWVVLMIYFELFVSDCMIQGKILSQPTLPWNLHPLLKTKALLHLLITSYFVIEVALVSIWKAFSKRTDK